MENIKLTILDFFKDLTFKEDIHEYRVKGKKTKVSVSGIIKNFVEEVDFNEKAINKDKRLELPEGSTQAEWDDAAKVACDLGTRVHLFGEVYPFNKHLKPLDGFEEAVVSFWNDVPGWIKPLIMELKMYHKEYMFPGTADIILYDSSNDSFIIGDYKTNKDLFKNFMGKTLLSPFEFLLDSPFSKYELQLSFYQILFEQLGLKVSGRKLVWLKPNGTYEMYDTRDYTKELKEYLKNNRL